MSKVLDVPVINDEAVEGAAKEITQMIRKKYDDSYKGEPTILTIDLGDPDDLVEIECDNKIEAIEILLSLNGSIRKDDMLKTLHNLVEGFENDLKSR